LAAETVLRARYGGDHVDYMALYRKYRPQTFDDVIGQGHVTTTLAREVAEGRIAHAYLFAGPRGTGKTTTARILAKSLNCEDRQPGGTPCGECSSCVAITQGNSLDVLELDAASHNSVDDIREIRMSVNTVASAATSKRVFVLDEAHMLSKAAGNALLKTLEEPPENVHFVLATTEPYKLLDTIRSRTQRFDFHPVPIEELAGYLSSIADREGYKTDPAALLAVSRHASGSVRDSLSLLEQVAALGSGTVDVGGVRRALGLADAESFARLADAIGGNDARAALELVAELSARGVDLRRFVAETIGFLRGVFLAHYAPNLAEISDEPADVLDSWRVAATTLSPGDALRAVDVLSEALVRLREGREERLMTELALIRLTRPETASDSEALVARIERLEKRLERAAETIPLAGARPTPSQPRAVEPAEAQAPARKSGKLDEPADRPRQESSADRDAGDEPPVQEGPSVAIGFDQLKKVWPGLFGSLSGTLGARRWALFRETTPVDVVGNTVILEVAHEFHLSALEQDDAVASIVETKLADLLGTPMRVEFRARNIHGDAGSPEQEVDLDQLEDRPDTVSDPESLLAAEFGAKVIDDQ
jgi:DNA polymerase III subunit gamma/tau